MFTETEKYMRKSVRWSTMLPIFVCAVLILSHGCQTAEQSEAPQWIQIPIADVADVAGEWDGLMRRIPPERRDDWVTVTISSSGQYQFTSLRTIGVFSGQGEFAVNDGRLKSSSERGSIEAVLFEASGQRMLKANGRTTDGTEYTAEVKPAKR